jgi:hypothetical protein
MPSVFKVLGFFVYFWSNEGKPLEPIHVHVSKKISPSGSKFWLYSDGSIHLESNGARLTETELRKIQRILKAHFDEIVFCWEVYFKVKAVYKDQL